MSLFKFTLQLKNLQLTDNVLQINLNLAIILLLKIKNCKSKSYLKCYIGYQNVNSERRRATQFPVVVLKKK